MEADSAGQTQEVIILVFCHVFGANFHFPTNFIHSLLCGFVNHKSLSSSVLTLLMWRSPLSLRELLCSSMQTGPLGWGDGGESLYKGLLWSGFSYQQCVTIKHSGSDRRVLPSDMLLRMCRKHMSRFLISSRSSLSQRSTVLPRADAHWF